MAFLGALVLVAPEVAHAADPSYFKLDFGVAEGVEGCPDEAGLRAKVAARLGYDPFDDKAPRTLVTRFRKLGAGVRSHIELHDETGKLRGVRDLDASTCADLTASTTFAIAIAIDPERANAGPPPPPPIATPPPPTPTPPPKEPAPPPASPPAPVPREPAPPNKPWVPSIFLGGFVAGLGPYAGFTGGIDAGVVVDHGAFGFGVEGIASIPSSVDAGSGQVRTQIMGAAPLVCARIAGAGLCARAFFGAFQGAAEDVEAPEKQTTFFSTIGLHASYRWYPVGGVGFALEPHAGADAVLTRTRVNFRGSEVWSTSPVALDLGLRAAYSFF